MKHKTSETRTVAQTAPVDGRAGDYKLTTHSLARKLKPFGIKPAKARPDGMAQARGYFFSQFEKVWRQYDIGGGTLGTLAGAKLAKASSNPILQAVMGMRY
jgi:hypothetical protein